MGKPKKNGRNKKWKALTWLSIITTALIIILVGSVFLYPELAFKIISRFDGTTEFSDTQPLLTQEIPSPPPTQTALPSATSTPTLTASPTPTIDNETILPSQTPDASILDISKPKISTTPDKIFFTPTPTHRVRYLYPFVLVDEPIAQSSPHNINMPNPIFNCTWMGVAGQIFDENGNPLVGQKIWLGGSIKGEPFDKRGMRTGDAPEYGEAGYEFRIAEEVFESELELWVQVASEDSIAVSAKAHFSTFAHCTHNLTIINFQQVPYP